MTPTVYHLHEKAQEAELHGFRHYAAALRVLLEMQLGRLAPESAAGSVLTLAGEQKPVNEPETDPACPRCTSTETAQHLGDCVHYKWCLDCSYQWDHC